jgi:hypothetical protein
VNPHQHAGDQRAVAEKTDMISLGSGAYSGVPGRPGDSEDSRRDPALAPALGASSPGVGGLRVSCPYTTVLSSHPAGKGAADLSSAKTSS